jgi:pSer/pThr/pTyr-binding forkhead associated (FHA) protein
MARFIVLKGKGKAQIYTTSGLTTDVGRSDEMDLVLPDVSVSRHHARITDDRGDVQIEDMGSQNGVQLKGERLIKGMPQRLNTGDEVHVGNLVLVLLKPSARFYKGRFVQYMTSYSPHTTDDSPPAAGDSLPAADSSGQSTQRLSLADLDALQKKRALIQNARVYVAKNETMYWHPEERTLTFGKDAMVTVGGFLTKAVAAEVVWEDNWHVLKKADGLAKVYANNKVIRTHRLRNGDRFKVGDTEFVYQEQ